MAAEPQTAFFSYSRDDSEFALRLAEDLKDAGAYVWMDQLDLVGGQRWAQTVQEALEKCPLLLIVLSPSSVSSTNTMDEVTFALDEKKTVVPVLLHDCKIPYRLRSLHHIDFRSDHARGLKAVLKALGVEPQAPAAGSAAHSAVPKDAAADISDAEKRKRAAELQRPVQDEKRTTEQARLEAQEREHLAAEKKARQLLTRKLIFGIAGGLVVLLLLGILWWRRSHSQTSHSQTAVQQPQQQTTVPRTLPQGTERQPKGTEQKPQTAVQPPPQTTQPKTVVRQPKNTEQQVQTAAPQTQPQKTEQQPQSLAADVKKPVAKNCPEGVYCDPDTNLMWTVEDNGKDIDWPDAERYCKSLGLAGHSDWRLPAIDELEKLYDPANSNFYKIRKPLRLTASSPWSSTKQGSGSAWVLHLCRRSAELLPHGRLRRQPGLVRGSFRKIV